MLALGLTLACHGSSTEPRGGVLVATHGTAFDRAPDGAAAMVPFLAVNTSGSVAYLPRCGERVMVAVDRWEDGRWVDYSGDACTAVLPMDPFPLQPGTRYEGQRSIGEPGRYRLRLGVSWSPGGEGAWWSRSDAFTVR